MADWLTDSPMAVGSFKYAAKGQLWGRTFGTVSSGKKETLADDLYNVQFLVLDFVLNPAGCDE